MVGLCGQHSHVWARRADRFAGAVHVLVWPCHAACVSYACYLWIPWAAQLKRSAQERSTHAVSWTYRCIDHRVSQTVVVPRDFTRLCEIHGDKRPSHSVGNVYHSCCAIGDASLRSRERWEPVPETTCAPLNPYPLALPVYYRFRSPPLTTFCFAAGMPRSLTVATGCGIDSAAAIAGRQR